MSNFAPLRFPTHLDNTAVSNYRKCQRAHFWNVYGSMVRPVNELSYSTEMEILSSTGIVPIEESIHLSAGSAFAAGIEACRKAYYIHNCSVEESIWLGQKIILYRHQAQFHNAVGSRAVKDGLNMALALEFYFQQWPLGTGLEPIVLNGEPTVEFSFAVPIPHCFHPITGEPILYTGRCDMIGMLDGMLKIEDDKTTSQLGDSWFARWPMAGQLNGYYWALSQYGLNPVGCLVRGVSITSKNFGSAEYNHFPSKQHIDEWLFDLVTTVHRMLQDWTNYQEHGMAAFTRSWGDACSNYGGCHYLSLCRSHDPVHVIPLEYRQNTWSPLVK